MTSILPIKDNILHNTVIPQAIKKKENTMLLQQIIRVKRVKMNPLNIS